MKIGKQLAMVTILACVATWVFDVGGPVVRLLLVGPVFPGAMAGLLLSGHGGNHAVALTTALLTNSVIWCAAWLGLRGFL